MVLNEYQVRELVDKHVRYVLMQESMQDEGLWRGLKNTYRGLKKGFVDKKNDLKQDFNNTDVGQIGNAFAKGWKIGTDNKSPFKSLAKSGAGMLGTLLKVDLVDRNKSYDETIQFLSEFIDYAAHNKLARKYTQLCWYAGSVYRNDENKRKQVLKILDKNKVLLNDFFKSRPEQYKQATGEEFENFVIEYRKKK